MPSPDQFTSLFVRHERQLYGFIAAMLGQPTDAEDLLQETAKKLWREFDRYDPEKSFLGWAQTLARYEVLNYWQRQKTRRKVYPGELSFPLREGMEALGYAKIPEFSFS